MTRQGWCRRVLLAAAVLAAASAQAAQPLRPAEEPPADFAGRQFIDSSGCVFVRDGKLWTPRVGRDGGLVCGYPPTPVPRVAAAAAADTALALDGMGRIEAELVTTLASGLRPGDLVAPDPVPAADEAPAAGGETDLAGVMAAAVAASPALARASAGAGTRDNARLCGLLGIVPAAAGQALGGDPTGGFCGGGAVAPVPRIAQAETGARQAAASAAISGGTATPRARPSPAGKTAATNRAAPPPAARTAEEALATPAGLIPAGTRFLRVGTYPDAAAAEAVLRRIAALGLPVARSRRGAAAAAQAVLAGPFDGRQAVVRAHDRLTRAGFSGLLPMR